MAEAVWDVSMEAEGLCRWKKIVSSQETAVAGGPGLAVFETWGFHRK
jgi:hypothetical protein